MKKQCVAVLIALCAAATLAAQQVTDTSALPSRYSNVGLLNTSDYAGNFLNKDTGNIDSQYVSKARANREEALRIAGISGSPTSWDTAEEITLLSATTGVISARPVEAARMLPADDPALVDLQLGAMLYMKKAVVSFLGGGDPAKYAVELKFITDRGRVTETDIVNFVKQGISEIVNEQFKNTLLPPREIQAIKDILAIFFLRPNITTFNAARDVSFIYTVITTTLSGEKKKAYENVTVAYDNTLRSLNPELLGTIVMDVYNDFRYKSNTDTGNGDRHPLPTFP
jgi:hypothetical protein